MDGWMPPAKTAQAVIETRSLVVCEPDCLCKAYRALLACCVPHTILPATAGEHHSKKTRTSSEFIYFQRHATSKPDSFLEQSTA